VRGDRHAGLRGAVQRVWPKARFSTCRVHARQKIRDHSITMGNEHRHAWLQVLYILEQCGSQAEFDAFIGVASSLIRHGFGDIRAAENLEKEWNGDEYSRWHITSSGTPACPPENNALESVQRVVKRAIGQKAKPIELVLPDGLQSMLERERTERRDEGAVREDRVPWFWQAGSVGGAKALLEAHESGTVTVLCLDPTPGQVEYAVSAGTAPFKHATEEKARRRHQALAGRVTADQYALARNSCNGLNMDDRASVVGECLQRFQADLRAVHIVTMAPVYGAISGVDGWACDCKGYWDNAQCKHLLAVAHMEGEIDLFQRAAKNTSGRRLDRRPSRVVAPQQGKATKATKQRGKRKQDEEEHGADDANYEEDEEALIVRSASAKTRRTRPAEYARGRAKQRKGKGKSTKKKN